jgi:hypothetical protein
MILTEQTEGNVILIIGARSNGVADGNESNSLTQRLLCHL